MIEYRVICDGCGVLLATDTRSVRSARATAQLVNGANKGPDGDKCAECRKKMATLSPEDMAKAAARGHSTSGSQG